MSYFTFLIRFLVIPILLLLSIYIWERRRTASRFMNEKMVWIGIIGHIVLALLYTTPWDNYLVATGVWYYNPALVTGILLGYVPLEEYMFFVLETLLVGLWWWFLAGRTRAEGSFESSRKLRFLSSAILSVVWLASVIVLLGNWKPGTYLSITLAWALPPIVLQLAFGADILWHERRLVVMTILPLTLYLSFTDSLAIRATTWAIHPAQSTGLFIHGLPMEEGIFFLLTITLVTFGMTLLLSPQSRQQLRWKI